MSGWIILLCAVGLLALMWQPDPPATSATKLSLMFLGYTNDSSGQQLAQFTASNNGPTTLRLEGEFAVPTGVLNYSSIPSTNSQGLLSPHQIKTFTISKLTNATPWSLRVLYTDWGWQQRLTPFLRKTGLIRFVPKWDTMQYGLAESTVLNP